MLQPIIHYGLHFILPIWIALRFYPTRWKQALLVLWLTMLVDLDHLLATQLFDACRCSINFHPLHSTWAIGVYLLLLVPAKTRLIAIGLLLHMLADGLDCWMNTYSCV